jgi:hypothetical protein
MQEAEFLRVDQAAGAVVVEHETVLGYDLFAQHVLGKGEAVADHLEHERIARQGEHQHDHAANAVGMDEVLVRIGSQVAEEVAEALGLALLGAAKHGVDLVDRLVRQQGVQEHYRIPDRGQVRVQVAARVAEDLGDVLALDQHRLGADAVGVVHEGDDQRGNGVDAEDAPDQIGAAVAVEHRFEQLDRAHRFLTPGRQARGQRIGDAHRAQAGVRIGRGKRVVVEDLLADARQVAPHRVAVARDRVGDAIGRVDVEGDEFDAGVDPADAEEPPRQGVEPGHVQLLVEQPCDRCGVGVAHRAPERAIAWRGAEHALDALDHLADAAFVQLDALAGVVLRAMPVARLEAALRAPRDRTEARVIVGEAGAQLARADIDQGFVDRGRRGIRGQVHAPSLMP